MQAALTTTDDGSSGAGSSSNAIPGAGRLGGWLKSKAASIEEHVKEFRENSKMIVSEVADTVSKDLGKAKEVTKKLQTLAQKRALGASSTIEVPITVTFLEGSLGFDLDLQGGGRVLRIKPGKQAESLGVQLQDRLVAIGGVPLPAADDACFVEVAKQHLSKMARPVTLTFMRDMDDRDSVTPSSTADTPLGPKHVDGEGSFAQELAAARELADRLQAELRQAQGELAAVREEAAAVQADLQLSKAWRVEEVAAHQAELSHLHEDIARLRDGVRDREELEVQLGAARDELLAALATAGQARELLSRQETEMAGLRHAAEQAELRRAELSAPANLAEAFKGEAAEMRQDLQDHPTTVAVEGDQRIVNLQAALDEERQQRAQLQQSHQELEATKQTLEQQLAQAHAELQVSLSVATEAREHLSRGEAEVAEVRQLVGQAEAQCLELAAGRDAALHQAQQAEEAKAILEASLAEAARSLEDQTAGGSLQAALGQEQHQREQLQQKQEGLEAAVRNLEEQLAIAQEELQLALATAEQARDHLSRQRAEVEELRQQVEHAQAHTTELSAGREAALHQAQESEAATMGLESKLAEAERCLREHSAMSSQHIMSLQAALDGEREQHLQLLRAHEELEATRQGLEEQLHEAKAARWQLRQELSQAESELRAHDELQRRLVVAEKALAASGAVLPFGQGEKSLQGGPIGFIDAAAAPLAEEHGRREQLQRSLDEAHAARRALEEELRNVVLERDMLREELDKAEADLRAAAKAAATADGGMVQPLPLLPQTTTLGKAAPGDRAALGTGDAESHCVRPCGAPDAPVDQAPPDELHRLWELVAELEAQNLTLKRSLDSRPIVFQFASPDLAADVAEPVVDEDETVEQIELQLGDADFQADWRMMLYGAALWCRRAGRSATRQAARGVGKCRQQRQVSGVEQQLRSFTRLLLRRPLLMWLFYVQLLALWFLVFWHQALSSPLISDPSERLEDAVKAATAGGR